MVKRWCRFFQSLKSAPAQRVSHADFHFADSAAYASPPLRKSTLQNCRAIIFLSASVKDSEPNLSMTRSMKCSAAVLRRAALARVGLLRQGGAVARLDAGSPPQGNVAGFCDAMREDIASDGASHGVPCASGTTIDFWRLPAIDCDNRAGNQNVLFDKLHGSPRELPAPFKKVFFQYHNSSTSTS